VKKYDRARQPTEDNIIRRCTLHARYIRLHTHTRARARARTHTHTQNMWYLLIFLCNNGCIKTPQCYVLRTLPVRLRL